ncbi:MAG: UDP-N-acetylmuramoyl-L-alanyl-D-glutamate--2,6-diaminopimelate ligase [Pseudomonadota bacterium]
MMAARMSQGWTLDQLLDGVCAAPPVTISDVTLDSRAVTPGALFLALQGMSAHGIAFAPQALQRGAVAVVTDLPSDDERLRGIAARVPVVSCVNNDNLASLLAKRFFAHPSAALDTFAVTGTNGKTSIAWLVANALMRVGRQTALSGTLGFGLPDALASQTLTTPDAVTLHRQAREFCEQGCQAMVFEASSHAMDQGRLADICVDIALFSNLTRDHLDYHADMDAYFEAKASLFEGDRHARIVCCDDRYGRALWQRHADSAWQVCTRQQSIDAECFVSVTAAHATADGLDIECATHLGQARIRSALVGAFNVQNLALAFAAILCAGIPLAQAADVLSQVSAPPGRMQRVPGEGPKVYVDFAHTPAALAEAIATLGAHAHGALWCVFGCGGDRDRGKRALMAKAASAAARIVVTSDNPRHESSAAIIEDIVAGFDRDFAVEADREQAIVNTILNAGANDTILIAGKGHEKFQLIGDDAIAFDDVAIAARALQMRGRD